MMNRKVKQHTNIHAFLESTGILENGSDAEIKAMKKKYWSDYKREHRRNKRETQKLLTFWCTKTEYNILSKEAVRYGMSRPTFSKQSVFAYINKKYIIPDIAELHRVQQLLLLNHTTLQQLFEDRVLSVTAEEAVMQLMKNLEKQVLAILHHPRTLEALIKIELANNPDRKERIQEIITNY